MAQNAEKKFNSRPVLLSCFALITVWSIVVTTLSNQFSLEYFFDIPALVAIFAVVLPIQIVLTTKCKVSWAEVWLSLGVPLGLLWSLLGTRGMTLDLQNIQSEVVHGATAVALLTVLYGGLVSAFGFFGLQDVKDRANFKRLSKPYFSLCCALILGLFLWSMHVALGFSNAFSVEPIVLLIATLISACILKQKASIEILCQGTLFSALLSLMWGLIFWYQTPENPILPLDFIHAGLLYSLLVYITLYLYSFTGVERRSLNTGLFNWHWLEVIAFFTFMLWAPETIRETLKNSEDAILTTAYEAKLEKKLAAYGERLAKLEHESGL